MLSSWVVSEKGLAVASFITRKKLSSFRIVILGFAIIIFFGTTLLMLPISSRSGEAASFSDAIFTATSATCVTGLVVRDTASGWTAFGQIVILTMIQLGGLGVVLASASFALISGKRISLGERSMLQSTFAAPKVEGMVRMVKFIIKVTLITELVGAVAMMPTLCGEYGIRGVWLAVFLSISAFCNAGFDILGTPESPYVSLTSFADNPSIVIVISLLIVLGGIGFFTWDDIVTNRGRFKRYSMQSKVILSTTAMLIVIPALYFFVFEYETLPASERTLASLFHSVTTRTAGFNVEDLSTLTEPSQAFTIILMLIGGSPGSTAGGIKTTTFTVLLANFAAVCFRREETHLYGRRIVDDIVKQASAIFMMYVGLALLGGAALCHIEGIPYLSCLFECASALGTVGLTRGITPSLCELSRIILMLFMFLGRVGGLTVVYAATKDVGRSRSRLPHEEIAVG